MVETQERIAAGLELAFAEQGFTEPSVPDLRDASGVSLRTLYRHFPSREDMIVGALEHRHRRYLAFLFDDQPDGAEARLAAIFDRIREWMRTNSPKGCLFQNAVAAHPHNARLRRLLVSHKREVGARLAAAVGLPQEADAMRQIHEGVIASWAVQGEEAVAIGRRLCALVLESDKV